MADPSVSTDTWLRRFREAAPDAPRLVCFPHAGGSASYFLPVSKALAPAAEVLAVQYPGRQDRRAEPGLTAVAELADQASAAIGRYTDRPMAFFGHSMGAVVAYEVALRLGSSMGFVPQRLFASGRRAPSRYRDDQVHQRDDAGLLREVQRLSGTDASMLADPETVGMILPALRSDYTAIETYQHVPQARVSCPITVLTGVDDPRTTLDEARAWSGHTTGDFELCTFPGGHFFLNEHAEEVIGVIASRLGG